MPGLREIVGQQRKTLLSGLGVFSVRLVTTPLGLVVTVVLTRILDTQDFGRFTFLVSLSGFLALPLTMGLPTLLIREVSGALDLKRYGLARGITTWSLELIVLASLAMAGILIVLSQLVVAFPAIPLPRLDTAELAWVVLLIPALAVLHWSQSLIAASGKVVYSIVPDGIFRPLFFLAVFISAYGIAATSTDALGAYFGGVAFAVLVSFFFMRRAVPSPAYESPAEYDTRFWIRSLLPLSMIGALAAVQNYTDFLMLGTLSDTTQLAVYKVASQIATLPIAVMLILNAVTAPIVARAFARGEKKEVRREVAINAIFGSLAAVMFLVAFLLTGRIALDLVFGARYVSSYAATVILSAGVLVSAACGPVVMLLNMSGRERLSMRYAAISAGLNVALNAALIPVYGSIGAAIATMASTIVMQIQCWYALMKVESIRCDFFAFVSLPEVARKNRKDGGE